VRREETLAHTPASRGVNLKASRAAVVGFVTGLRWDDVPGKVQDKALRCTIDNAAALLAGAQWPSSRMAALAAVGTYQAGAASLVAHPARLSPDGAAFANCVAANAVDLDDVSIWTWGHPGAQVFPVALAFTEAAGGSGADLLAAMLVGYEVAFRVGRCMFADVAPVPERDYRGCGAWGAPAAAAVAARVLGLAPEQVWHALGIAEYHAPFAPILYDIANPTMVKHGHGAGAAAGVVGARLAQQGFTGTPSTLGHARFADVVTDLGETYLLPGRGVEWKEYACCLFMHPALFAVRTLLNETPFAVADVDRVDIEAPHDAHLLFDGVPTASEEAQFSQAWAVAALLADREVSPRQTDVKRLSDGVLLDLFGRIEMHRSAELDRLYWLSEANDPEGKEAARVVVELRDGRRLDSGVVEKPLVLDDTWTMARLEEKFRWATRDVMPPNEAEALLAVLRELPALDDVGELTAVIRRGLAQRHDAPTSPAPHGAQ
jgi:2-methylcitrate dehydratase PrpD